MSEKADPWYGVDSLEEVDWRDTSPLANAYVDLLLLSLIRAHPMQSGKKIDEYERLRDAKEAIFGIKPIDDLKDKRDLPLLADMAKEYVSQRGGAKFDLQENRIEWGDASCKKDPQIKAIARKVVRHRKKQDQSFYTMVDEESVVARLARKFRKNKDSLLLQVAIHGEIETGFMVEWVNQAKEFFGPFMIPVADADDPVRDLKRLF